MVERRIAYLSISYFGTTVACRAEPALADRPLALLDDQGYVLAADFLATRSRVVPGLPEQQAATRCPDITCLPAARYPIYEAQAALLERLGRYTGRWQPEGLGSVYLDASESGPDVLAWCRGLTGEVNRLGLMPSFGVTTSKFSATIAGQAIKMGTMLMLSATVQPAFLTKQSVAFLPLESDTLTQLRYLGIRTLGQFARLPATGVLARFGEAGRTAQRWAQGRDDRPIVSPGDAPEFSARIEFDGPVADRDILLAALMRRAEVLLKPLQARLQAVARLALSVTRVDGRTVPAGYTFSLPTASTEAHRLALITTLDRVTWNSQPAADITLTLAGITDAPAQQLALFEADVTPREALVATLNRLAARYGPDTFRMAVLTDPAHPLPERRVSWQKFD